MRTKNRSRIAAVVALLAASLPLFAQPASADDFAPEITSFTRTSAPVLGGEQLIAFVFGARDEGPAGLMYAHFEFKTPLGGYVRVDSPYMARLESGTFTATKLLSPWAASGRYTLDSVYLFDREGNKTLYERGGDHEFDLAASDFEVENPLEDVTSPTVTSARLFETEVVQGTPVVMLYSAEDDLSGVDEVGVIVFSPSQGQFHLRSLPGLAAAGPAAWLVPLSAPSGTYQAHAIYVADRAGNRTLFDVDGRVEHYPPGATPPAGEHADPRTLAFTVHGTTGDRLGPQMTRFAPDTPDRRRLGDLVALDYAAFDAGTGIVRVTAEWEDGRGHTLYATKTCGDLGSGPISTRIEDYRTVGSDWSLEYVSFADYLGNHVNYLRDGRVLYSGGDPGPPVHTFDLSRADFHIEPGPPSSLDLLDTSSLYCPRVAEVSLALDDADVLYGDLVETVGSVTGPQADVAQPIVAIHEHLRDGPRLVGVVEGDAGGRYRESFRAEENAKLSATFLGLDGPRGAEPGTSRKVSLTVRPGVGASLADDSIPSGEATRLVAEVTPARAAQSVLLQSWDGRRWKTVQRAAGAAHSFVVRPPRPGTFRYRVVVPASTRLAAGRSAPVVLTVRRS